MGYIGRLVDDVVFIAGGGLVRNWIAVEELDVPGIVGSSRIIVRQESYGPLC